jgi:hypothetical protein
MALPRRLATQFDDDKRNSRPATGIMASRVYCTYFDHNYLPRGLALYHSLQRHAPGAELWVLCLSEACHQALLRLELPHLVAVRLSDFEAANPDVAATRSSRSQIEYYFTCSPAWILFVLESSGEAEWATYLDSDLFFFASPDPIYEEMKDAAFGIIPHRFSRGLEDQRRFGLYNVGWVSARKREDGIAVLRWWRERCIEWCYDRVEGDRFADQRYLDRMPEMSGVHVISHLGANLAPWNIADCRLEWNNGRVEIERRYPLLFFHFYGVKRSGGYYFNSHRFYHAPFSGLIKEKLYEPYAAALASAERSSAPLLQGEQFETIRKPVAGNLIDRLLNALRKARMMAYRGFDIVTGRAVAVR